MTPYTSFLYFGITLYVVIPALVTSFFRRIDKIWLVIASLIMLVIQYTGVEGITLKFTFNELAYVAGYAVLQWLIALGFLLFRRRRRTVRTAPALAPAVQTQVQASPGMPGRDGSRWVFYLALLLGLLPLLAAKFIPLFQSGYALFFLGLSYITFRCLDVIIGIQDELITSVPPIQYLTFLLFFPPISSGPIDRYQRFAEDWQHPRSRPEFLLDLDGAIHRVFTGFLYKFILASLIQQYWLDPMSKGANLLHIGSYMYAYTFYLFFDFAGYSAFAVGFSYLFGIHTPENFDRPFLSRDIRDFWNRWHISLSFWFRDHIYNRFVFAALKGHWFKNRYTASYLGYVITMGLMGLWHGTAWHYIVYGFYHGLLLAVTAWLDRRYKGNRLLNDQGLGWRALSILITFHLIAVGLLIFSGRLF